MGIGATDAVHRIPDISVIVPVYNAEMTLHRCIKGILSQTHTDFELILVNDGSTDSSLEICRSYSEKDSRVKVVDKPNEGVSSARNAGLDNATGTYVAFCDSDDYPEKDWLRSMRGQAGEDGLVVCAYRIHSAGGSVTDMLLSGADSVRRYDDPTDILGELLRERLLNFVWNKLFVRSRIESASVRFKEAFKVFEDECFVLDYLIAGCHTVYVPYCGYNYFLPEGFILKYSFDIDRYTEVIETVYRLLGTGSRSRPVLSRRRMPAIPSLVYWYKTALAPYVAVHGYSECRDRIRFASRIARDFSSGPLNHLSLKILPCRTIYFILKCRRRPDKR